MVKVTPSAVELGGSEQARQALKVPNKPSKAFTTRPKTEQHYSQIHLRLSTAK
jgi:hypothetical protein